MKLTGDQREYAMAQAQGFPGTFVDYKNALSGRQAEGAKLSEQIAAREQNLVSRGLDPNDSRFQKYLLTGSLPDEKDDRTAEQKDYEAAKKEGYSGKLVDFINLKGNATRAQTTINNAVNPVLNGLGDQFVTSADEARAAAGTVRAVQNARSQLDAPGGIYTGTFADNRLALQKLGATLGVSDPAAIQNTETFRTQIKPIVLETVKGLGSGSGISNADRDFALQAVGGDIKLDEGTIRRVLDITERANRAKIDRHNVLADQMLETQPELKQVGPMLRIQSPEAQVPAKPEAISAQRGATTNPPSASRPKYGSVKIPMTAVQDLKGMPDTPENRAYFDDIFGDGASARILGRGK